MAMRNPRLRARVENSYALVKARFLFIWPLFLEFHLADNQEFTFVNFTGGDRSEDLFVE